MKKIMQFTLIVIFLLFTNYVNAKLNLYNCNNHQDKKTCSVSCHKTSLPHTFEFLVNTSNNSVIKNFYISSNLEKSEPLENCKVIDKNNWVCNVLGWGKDLKTKNHLMGSQVMSNGVYFYSHTDGSTDYPAWCLK
jgi:hypothetical protein